MSNLYALYAGLGGGFGGSSYQGIFEFDSEEEAFEEAYRLACEEYESYEGMHGILDREDCKEDYYQSYGKEPSEEELEEFYAEHKEHWIEYYAKRVNSREDVEDECE